MKYLFLFIIPFAFIAKQALALTPQPALTNEKPVELHIMPDGTIRLVGVELWQRNASNLYTLKAWGLKWRMEIPYGFTILSNQGAPVKLDNVKPGDLLEIKGSLFTQNLEYLITPSYVRDLSIQTAEPTVAVPAPSVKTSLPPAPPSIAKTAEPQPKGLYMNLKKGYRGEQVSLLQKFLARQGLIGDDMISGYFGDGTEKALKQFQEKNLLEATGTTGPKTRALINADLPK